MRGESKAAARSLVEAKADCVTERDIASRSHAFSGGIERAWLREAMSSPARRELYQIRCISFYTIQDASD